MELPLVLCAAKRPHLGGRGRKVWHGARPFEIKPAKIEEEQTIMAASYIPAKDADFDPWLNNFQGLVAATPNDYGLVAGDATIITASYTAWHNAYVLSTNPATRTTPAVAAKDAQRASAEATVRPYAQQIARNAGIDPSLVTGLGLNLPNPTRPPVPAPTATASLTLVSATFLRHNLSYRTVDLGPTKRKPVGAIGIEIWRAVGVAAAVDPVQCSLYQSWTKSPNISEFVAGDRGKIATYFARFATRSGPGGTVQTGPWSDPLAIVVM
jgi:hypothetical protein